MAFSYYLQVFVKLICSVLLLLLYIKVSGKSQLAPMTAFDQIGNMVVGAIGGSTLLNPEISVLDSAVFMGAWILILLLIRFARSQSLGFKQLIDGKRVQLMRDGVLLTDNFEKANVTVENISILLHKEGLTGLCDARNIWFEPNGQLTVDKKGDVLMSQILVEEGKINAENLEQMKKDEAWLKEMILRQQGPAVEDIFLAEWVEERLWVYPYKR